MNFDSDQNYKNNHKFNSYDLLYKPNDFSHPMCFFIVYKSDTVFLNCKMFFAKITKSYYVNNICNLLRYNSTKETLRDLFFTVLTLPEYSILL